MPRFTATEGLSELYEVVVDLANEWLAINPDHLLGEDAVRREAHVYVGAVETRLQRTYPRREYCVQYRETDLEFVLRLLASGGVTFFFRHHERTETLVLCDGAHACGRPRRWTGPPLPIAGPEMATMAVETARRLAWERETKPTGVAVRDFDFTRPGFRLEGVEPRRAEGTRNLYTPANGATRRARPRGAPRAPAATPPGDPGARRRAHLPALRRADVGPLALVAPPAERVRPLSASPTPRRALPAPSASLPRSSPGAPKPRGWRCSARGRRSSVPTPESVSDGVRRRPVDPGDAVAVPGVEAEREGGAVAARRDVPGGRWWRA